MEKPLTRAEAAAVLGCSISTLQRMMRRKDSPKYFQFEREYRFDRKDIQEWKDAKKQGAAA